MSIMERNFDVNGTETKELVIGEGVKFERIRRITGYLVGTLSRWNSGKLAELKDRVSHSTGGLEDGAIHKS